MICEKCRRSLEKWMKYCPYCGTQYRNITIYQPSIVGEGVIIGEGTKISSLSYVDSNSIIGKNCNIKPLVYIAENTTIGDNCFIAPGVIILNDRKPPSKGKHWEPVKIGNNVSIGGGCTIAPGVIIGNNAKIRMGSKVTRNINDNEYYRGE